MTAAAPTRPLPRPAESDVPAPPVRFSCKCGALFARLDWLLLHWQTCRGRQP